MPLSRQSDPTMADDLLTEHSFKFTQLPVERQLVADLQPLASFTPEQLQPLTEMVLNFLARQSADPDAEVAQFAQQHGVGAKVLKTTLTALIFFLGEALKRNLAAENVQEDLIAFGLDARRAKYMADRFGGKFVQLSESMIEKTLKVNQLVDMEWRFGVTAANDELAQVGKVFLQLKLVVDRGDGVRETVPMELTLPQFYAFLQELQKAQVQLR